MSSRDWRLGHKKGKRTSSERLHGNWSRLQRSNGKSKLERASLGRLIATSHAKKKLLFIWWAVFWNGPDLCSGKKIKTYNYDILHFVGSTMQNLQPRRQHQMLQSRESRNEHYLVYTGSSSPAGSPTPELLDGPPDPSSPYTGGGSPAFSDCGCATAAGGAFG